MALQAQAEWLKRITDAKTLAENKAAVAEAIKKRDFVKDDQFIADVEAAKKTAQDLLKGMSFGKSRNRTTKLMATGHDRETSSAVDRELDSYADRMENYTEIQIKGSDGKIRKLAFNSPEAGVVRQQMDAAIEPLLKMSRDMAKQGFTDKEIERELWSPLVRQKAIPSNLVPKQYSHYCAVMDGASQIYEDAMLVTDATVGQYRKTEDKLLGALKDIVKIGGAVGGELIRHFDGVIEEGTREDLSEWIRIRETGAWKDLKAAAGDMEFSAYLSEQKALLNTSIEGKLADGQSVKDWVEANPDDPDAQEYAKIEEAQLYDDRSIALAENIQHKAIAACAESVMTGAIDARRKMIRKEKANSIVEGIVDTLASVAGNIVTMSQSAEGIAYYSTDKTEQFRAKYLTALAKSANHGVMRLIDAADAKGGDRLDLIKQAVQDLVVDLTANAVAATGEKNDTDDTRQEASQDALYVRMAGKAALDLTQVVRLVAKGDVKGAVMVLMSSGITETMMQHTGDIAAALRTDVADDPGGIANLWTEHGSDIDTDGDGIMDTTISQGGQTGWAYDNDLATRADQEEVDKLGAELTQVLSTKSGEVGRKEADALYAKIRDKYRADPGAQAMIKAQLDAQAQDLNAKMAATDMEKIAAMSDADMQARASERAMQAIQELTADIKKTEMQLKMLDMASKAGMGILLQAVPGTGMAMKCRDLAFHAEMLRERAIQLHKWKKNFETTQDNFSPYQAAVAGEAEVKGFEVAHDTLQVAADIAGVTAEAFRLADATHAGAAITASVEKGIKVLNDQWYKIWTKGRIQKGWELFKLAHDFPENRRLAREAIKSNTTLGKCVLAYGACVDGDPIARQVVNSCGLTLDVFQDTDDVCQAIVKYLEVKIGGDIKVWGDHSGASWHPGSPEINLKSWTMFKATAKGLKPPLSGNSFKTGKIDANLVAADKVHKGKDQNDTELTKIVQGLDDKALDDYRDALGTLIADLKLYSPMGDHDKGSVPHDEMKLAANAFLVAAKIPLSVADAEFYRRAGDKAKKKLAGISDSDDALDDMLQVYQAGLSENDAMLLLLSEEYDDSGLTDAQRAHLKKNQKWTEVARDGNCLFHCLAPVLNSDHATLRAELADAIRNDHAALKDVVADKDSAAKVIARDGTYTGEAAFTTHYMALLKGLSISVVEESGSVYKIGNGGQKVTLARAKNHYWLLE